MMWKWKRPAAFFLAAAMMVTMSGVPASAVEPDGAAASGRAPAECSCETHCEQEAVNLDCPVCSAENADFSACLGKEEAVLAVQALIDALPETVTEDNATEIEEQLKAIDAKIKALTDEQGRQAGHDAL